MKNKVKETREYYGLSLRELAKRVNAGAMTISDIETGKSIPNVVLAIKIARELKTTAENLFWEEDRENDKE